MKKVTLLAATAAVGALIASPVLANDAVQPRSAIHSKTYKSKHMSKSQNMSHQARVNRDSMAYHSQWNQRGDLAYQDRNRNDWNNRGWDNRRSEFWPGDVVGGAIGTAGAIATGAVNTAGAIATAPFGGPYRDSYAYRDTYAYAGPGYADTYAYNGVALPYSSNYAARNGFVCQPGTVFRGANGQPTLCQ
jgi:hypothetical protein